MVFRQNFSKPATTRLPSDSARHGECARSFGFADDHSPWQVMKLAMASCPEIQKIITFFMKSTGFIMVNPI